jgi:hypothetical protein
MGVLRVHSDVERRLLRNGYSVEGSRVLPSEHVPTEVASDPNTCPFAYCSCYGAKDPEFDMRCSGRTQPFMNCYLFKQQVDDLIRETTLPDPEKPQLRHTKASVFDSIDDGFADGAPIDDVVELSTALRCRNTGRRREYALSSHR